MAQAIGIRALAVIAVTFGLGTALAGVAGALLANQFFVYPTGGIPLSVYAYIAVVIGGWGSIAGAVIGAMIISLFQVVVSAYVSYAVATGLLYIVASLDLLLPSAGYFRRTRSAPGLIRQGDVGLALLAYFAAFGFPLISAPPRSSSTRSSSLTPTICGY